MVRKLLTGSLIASLLAGTAGADTLRDALVSAYQSNPTLTGQRQTLEATDAAVAIAKDIWWARPLAWLARIPGVMTALRALYHWVAARRHCAAERCERNLSKVS